MPFVNVGVNLLFAIWNFKWSKESFSTENGSFLPHKQVILVGQCQQILLRLETNSVDKLIYDL